jgi:cellulose biosynthesis protein BcsQ
VNPTEIYQFLITLVRAGPEVVAASLIALACGGAAGWWLTQKFHAAERRRLKESVKELETQVKDTQAKLHSTEKQLELTRENLALVTRALEDAQEARDESRNENADLQHRAEKLQQELHDERTKRVKAEADLGHAKEKLQAETKRADEAVAKLQPLSDEVVKARMELATAHEVRHDLLRKIALLDRHLTVRTKQLSDVQVGGNDIERKLGDALAEIEQWKQVVGKKDEELAVLQDWRNQLDSVAQVNGKVWTRPLPPDAPRFVPLGENRRCPIISVLNLKGGVGKTTIALNLAAALLDKGKRVLMVDCDHQRSLTNLCLRPSRRREAHQAGRTLQRYLLGPVWTVESFLAAVRPLPNMKHTSIVINTSTGDGAGGEGLAYAEEKLMLDWLLPPQPKPDVRLALRLALHSQAISGQYDYVLLDCPPRFTTACINAVAASDFLLIPLLLDGVSASGPLLHLLTELKKLREAACSAFEILGVVANRVAGNNADLQSEIWKGLTRQADTTWGRSVYCFNTMVKQAVAYPQAARILTHDEDAAVAIWQNAEVRRTFYSLTEELKERIAHETQRPPALSAQPG